MTTAPRNRPPLTSSMQASEFERWYWLQSELVSFARELGTLTSGSKDELAARISAVLAGEPIPHRTPRKAARPQITGPLAETTVIPAGQRCSQDLRAFFVERLGAGFRFDAHMREFIGAADGTTTLGDAVGHWHRTRGDVRTDIDPQFELNRFTRRWHAENPDGSRAELKRAWETYRDTPLDERGRA